jgi:hypothetical protein
MVSASERESATIAGARSLDVQFVAPELIAAQPAQKAPEKKAEDSSGPQVRLVAMRTDIARRCRRLIPALPFPPFSTWRRWLTNQFDAVHCSLEWRTESGDWYHAELRSTRYKDKQERTRVGWGELPGTAYDAYGIYISKGRLPRGGDELGHPVEITLDETIDCDYRRLEQEIRRYGARETGRAPGQSGDKSSNRGLGGPAFKPSQNSNTMVNFVLKACGVTRKAPEHAVGWNTVPHFPYSTEKTTFQYDNQP